MATKYGKNITFEVATLRGYRQRYRDSAKAREDFESRTEAVWLEEWHGNKLVKHERRGPVRPIW